MMRRWDEKRRVTVWSGSKLGSGNRKTVGHGGVFRAPPISLRNGFGRYAIWSLGQRLRIIEVRFRGPPSSASVRIAGT